MPDDSPELTTNPTGVIRQAIRDGDRARATEVTKALLADVTGQEIASVHLNADRYSLNSVNGLAENPRGDKYFFKFHQEEGEEGTIAEYYNAKVLDDAGYPVIRPLFQETTPGRQILVYPFIEYARLSDVCSEIEKGTGRHEAQTIIDAQAKTDRAFAEIALKTLHIADDPAARSQPIFQLFYNRLVDPKDPSAEPQLAGRVKSFYFGRTVRWPGLEAPFEALWHRPWTINGLEYDTSLKTGFENALKYLAPTAFLPGPAVTAHGDAHNANVFFDAEGPEGSRLVLFDPAFADAAVPALLAEVKATFHNIFAHPFWLYEPDIAAERFHATARLEDERIVVETDFELSPLRQAFLASKAENFWAPLLRELARRDQLPADWETRIRTALFACPTLVMNLLAVDGSSHNPTSSLIGLCQAIRVLHAPATGEDAASAFFGRIRAKPDQTGKDGPDEHA